MVGMRSALFVVAVELIHPAVFVAVVLDLMLEEEGNSLFIVLYLALEDLLYGRGIKCLLYLLAVLYDAHQRLYAVEVILFGIGSEYRFGGEDACTHSHVQPFARDRVGEAAGVAYEDDVIGQILLRHDKTVGEEGADVLCACRVVAHIGDYVIEDLSVVHALLIAAGGAYADRIAVGECPRVAVGEVIKV